MTIETVREIFGWMTLINVSVLCIWFLMILFAHDWLYQWHSRWFTLPIERFDSIHYAGMAVFKLALWLFNLTPYLALVIVG
jgi:hypothetical protein